MLFRSGRCVRSNNLASNVGRKRRYRDVFSDSEDEEMNLSSNSESNATELLDLSSDDSDFEEDIVSEPCKHRSVYKRCTAPLVNTAVLYTNTVFTEKPALPAPGGGHCACVETKLGRSEASAHAQCRQQRHRSGVTSESRVAL